MLVPRFRSLRVFSWLLLIAVFMQLYARKDALFGESLALAATEDVARFERTLRTHAADAQ